MVLYRFPAAHWPKPRSADNLERANKRIAGTWTRIGISLDQAH